MRRGMILLAALATALTVGGSAWAGYNEVTYDLTGSTLQTVVKDASGNVVSNDTDVVEGTWKLRLLAATKSAPLTANSPRMVGGNFTQHLYQPGAITITGTIRNRLLPPQGGTPGALAGNVIDFQVIPDNDSTGYQHCTGALCSAFVAPASVNIPLTPPRPNPTQLPNLNFFTAPGGAAATAPAASPGAAFTTDTATSHVSTGGLEIYLYNIYRGQEIDRYWISGDVPAMGHGALAAVAALLVFGGASTLMLRRRS